MKARDEELCSFRSVEGARYVRFISFRVGASFLSPSSSPDAVMPGSASWPLRESALDAMPSNNSAKLLLTPRPKILDTGY